MNRFKQTIAILAMAFLMGFIAAASSQAATANMPHAEVTIDWNSFNVKQYQSFPASSPTADLISDVFEGGDWVSASHNLLDNSDSNGDWSGITAVTGNQALAETNQTILFSEVSLENGGWASASATRSGGLYILDSGLVHISVNYNWSMWADQDPGSNQSAHVGISLSAYNYDNNYNWDQWKWIGMGQGDNNTDTQGSGTMNMFILVDPDDIGDDEFPIDFSIYANADVSAPQAAVPVPASGLMLFSGLIGLMMVRRRSV